MWAHSLLKSRVGTIGTIYVSSHDYFQVNGIPAICNRGVCYSRDGTDICRMFGNPCGTAITTTTPAPTTSTASYLSSVSCKQPCYLKSALDSIRNQVSSNVINVNGEILNTKNKAWFYTSAGGIPAVCDLRTNYCCATDYPYSSLCYRLGLSG